MRLPMFLLAVAACNTPTTDDTTPTLDDNFGVVETEGQDACDNLDGDGHCMLPFPSDNWRDAATGKLALVQATMPYTSSDIHLSVEDYDQDGFGISSPILFQLEGATLTGLPEHFDFEASLADTAHVVVVDAATGTRIPHWIEHDWLDTSTDLPIFVIRPGVPLPPGARLVVGVRGLVDSAGTPVDAPEGFAALRDQQTSHRRGVHARRAHYEADVFPVLEQAGFARADLQLAWDFTTRTDADAQQDLADVTRELYATLGDHGPTFDVTNVQHDVDGSIGLLIDAVAHVPSFLLDADDKGLRLLRRDTDGHVVTQGLQDVPFRIQVPNSVLDASTPAPVLQYGHGFLGSMSEADNGWLREMADTNGFSILSSDMQGMSATNSPTWFSVLAGDAGHMGRLADEALQGIANHLALQRLVKVGFDGAAPTELVRGDDSAMLDPTRIWYHGNSQGGTMGTLVVATSRDVHRGVLGVPGCCFSLLLDRSVDFVDWKAILDGVFIEPGDMTLMLAMLATSWDRMDGLTWAPRLADPLPDTDPHQVLLHVGLEDAQVFNQDSWILGRTVGAVQPTDNVRPIWGIPTAAFPITAPDAAIVNWDFKMPADPTPEDPPVKSNDTHGMPRRLHEAQAQSVHFLETGDVIDTCGGSPCVFDPP